MDEKTVAQEIWEKRQATLPSCLNAERLSPELLSQGLKQEKEETLFFLEHRQHGTVILRHENILEQDLDLSVEHRSWTYGSNTCTNHVWKYTMVCSCGESHVVVDENTPDEFKSI